DVYIRLFPEAAPKTVKNFKQLITDKYYDGLIFHRVIKDFMIQGGDPTGNGTGGKSIYGDKFEDEFDSTVLNIRGSLAMANSGPNSNGSQFFINQATSKQTDWEKLKQESVAQFADMEKQFEKAYSQKYNNWKKMFYDNCGKKGMPIATAIPDSAWKSYAENGSNMNLDGAWRTGGGHTVFGQVYEGLDVVDKIAGVKTGTGDKPAEDVKIVTAEIIKYQAK
ncbi:MAG: peptidylprolyl isomerase, partial [Oscillospiraceae bacterium]